MKNIRTGKTKKLVKKSVIEKLARQKTPKGMEQSGLIQQDKPTAQE